MQADDVRLRQRRVEPRQRLLAVGAPDDQLGDHRVVVRRDRIAFSHAGIQPHVGALEAGSRRRAEDVEAAGGRQEVGVGILGAQARLDGVAVDAQVALRERQRLARRDTQLPFDEVEPGDRFGHGVLDLQPRVHLHEVEAQVAVAGRLGDELDRAGADVAHRLGRGDRGLAHLAPALLAHARRGRFFEHLLVPSLHRAVALEQVDAMALRVAEHLDLDVARPRDVALDQHRVVAEAVDRLALARGERGVEFRRRIHHPHALGKADALGLVPEQRGILVGAVVTRHQRHAGFFHELLGRRLQPHGLDRRRRRADEDQARIGAGLGEIVVLAEEAVARMDRFGAGRPCRFDDAIAAQVAFLGRGAADVHRFVAGEHMQRAHVGIRIHGDRADAELLRRGRDAAGDLAAVGDQDLLEHGLPLIAARVARPRRQSGRTAGAPARAGTSPAARSP